MFIDRTKGEIKRAAVLYNPLNWFTFKKLKFFGTSAVVFFSLFILFYDLYGFQFAYESYIYHSERVDHRHNFSFNYYFEYFNYDILPETKYFVRKLGFVAQWGLVSFVGMRYYYDVISAVAIQTYIFVMFNRVITAQYFLWYMTLMPLVAIK
jgi:phosphatidylinositol glycan class M